MVQEKQLRELFKYIEANWDVCVEDVDKRDIKRIFGGVLCEDIMNDTLNEVKAEPIELKGNCSTFDSSRLVDQEYKPTDKKIDPTDENWNKWQLTKQPANSFDRDRFEAMFRVCAIIGNKDGEVPTWNSIFSATEEALNKLDAYYASKEGGGKL